MTKDWCLPTILFPSGQQENCWRLHIFSLITVYTWKGGRWGWEKGLCCLWLQYRFYTTPWKKELCPKLSRCLCDVSAAWVIWTCWLPWPRPGGHQGAEGQGSAATADLRYAESAPNNKVTSARWWKKNGLNKVSVWTPKKKKYRLEKKTHTFCSRVGLRGKWKSISIFWLQPPK